MMEDLVVLANNLFKKKFNQKIKYLKKKFNQKNKVFKKKSLIKKIKYFKKVPDLFRIIKKIKNF